jgi:cytochrome c oxidase subunit 2
MIVDVTGQQFAWSYRYKDPSGKPVQSNVLYLPVNKPVKFEIHSKDVIHSFWVPEFRLKQDAVPGITTTWRTTPNKLGVHDVVCTELCGPGHALMRGTVRVVPQGQFTAWLTKQAGTTAGGPGGAPGAAPAKATAGGGGTAEGKQIFATGGCGGCHKLAAAGSSGAVGPDLDNLLADARKLGRGASPAAYIRESIVNPNAVVVPGFPRGTMPATFGKQFTPQQIAALVQFLTQAGGGSKK